MACVTRDSSPIPNRSLTQRRRAVVCWHNHHAKSEHKRRSKLRAYASAGVKECWLVLGRERQIEVHRQPGEGRFAERSLHGPGARLTSAAIPSLTVDVSKLLEPI